MRSQGSRRVALVAFAAMVLTAAGSINAPRANAAGYTVYWSSSSSDYAWGDTWTTSDCTGTKKRLKNGGPTSATKVKSIRTFTYSDFVTYTTPAQHKVVPYNKCWKVPYSGLWTGYDPAGIGQ